MSRHSLQSEERDTAETVRSGMSWGIKQSFNRYVDAMPDGQRGAGAGATAMPDGTFFFELHEATDYEPATGLGTVKYQGDVRYKAHGGVLFVMIVDPWLEFTEDGAQLTVVDAQHWPDRERRMVLADLEPSSHSGLPPGWACLQARITAAGSEVFNNVYAPGDLLDPVRYSYTS